MEGSCESLVGEKLWEVLSYSGRFLFQFGQSEQCLPEDGLIYNLLSFYDANATTWTPAFMGLCLPL